MRLTGRLLATGALALAPIAITGTAAVAAPAPTSHAAATSTAAPAGGYWQEEQRFSNRDDCERLANSPLLSGRSMCTYINRFADPWTLFVYYYS